MAVINVFSGGSLTLDDSPRIGIRKEQIGFLASFVAKANLNQFDGVSFVIDDENFTLSFKFYNSNELSNAPANRRPYSLFYDNKSKKTMATNIVSVINKFKFIKKISELPNPLDRQFKVKQDSYDKKLWIAQLCPAFEHTTNSEADLRGVKGIYRYKRSEGEVVYIGMGDIRSRLNSPDRKEWDFDVIEYSIIKDPEKQAEWESYWLKKFKEEEGKLPFYNRISGKNVIRNSKNQKEEKD